MRWLYGFFLNRVDPLILRSVKEVTSTGVIHKKDEVVIRDEDGSRQRDKQEHKKSRKEIEEQVEKLNKLSEENALDIFFIIEEQNNQLHIKVLNKKTNQFIRTFNETEIEDIFNRLNNLSGIILDAKI